MALKTPPSRRTIAATALPTLLLAVATFAVPAAVAAPFGVPRGTPRACVGLNAYRASSATRKLCHVRTIPLSTITGRPDGGHEYHYEVGGSPLTITVPPANFNAVTASQSEREAYGMPREPPATEKAAHAHWEQELRHFHPIAPPQALYLPVLPAGVTSPSALTSELTPASSLLEKGDGGSLAKITHGGCSSCWAGYVDTGNLKNGPPSLETPFADAGIMYKEPQHLDDCEHSDASPWVGLGGYGTEPLDQAGTELGRGFGIAEHQAWIENYEEPVEEEDEPIPMPFYATPGAEFQVVVAHGLHNQYSVDFWNEATGQALGPITRSSRKTYSGSSAEYIMELEGAFPLTDFGTLEVKEAWAQHSGTGPLEFEHLALSSYAGKRRVASPSGLSSAESGHVFNITWEGYSESNECIREDPPPAVTTGAAKNVTTHSAVVEAAVNPETFETAFQFEWGLNEGYGTRSPQSPINVGSGGLPVGVGTELSGLQSCTTYDYRGFAENTHGSRGYGENASFRTRGLPVPLVHGVPESWVQFGPTGDYITAVAPCDGVVKNVSMVVPAGGSTVFSQEFPCGCEESVTSSDINLSGEPTGVLPLGVFAEDPWGDREEESPRTDLYVDHTPPVISLSGSAVEAREGQLGEGAYGVKFEAIDGSTSAPQSGAKEAWVEVDGVRRASAVSACERPVHVPAAGCFAVSGSLSFTGEELGVGQHQITVHARDWVGNESTRTLTVVVHAAAREAIGPGSVNLSSGDFELSASDVKVASGAVELGVGRTYHSRSAGGVEVLGPGWTLGLPGESGPGWRSLGVLANGSVVLTSAAGERLVFGANGSGGFVSPPGFQADVLSGPSGTPASYRLVEGDGTVVTFQAQGEAGFVPVKEERGGIDPLTYTFEVDASLPGKPLVPAQVLAPVPGGVSCTSKLQAGCRALSFTYAKATTAVAGEEPGDWGEVAGQLASVHFEGYEASKKKKLKLVNRTLAQYSYDAKGRLRAEWDPLIAPALKTVYGYDGEGHLTSVGPAGQEPWELSYAAVGGDPNTGRLATVSRVAGELDRTATWTMHYGVPVSGSEAPNNLEASQVERWAQKNDDPVVGTAIFPADEVPAAKPKSYSRANVYYLDSVGRTVDLARSGEGIETREYDNEDNEVRSLSPANRELALAANGESAVRAAQLDTETTYNPASAGMPAGSVVTEVLGPQHLVKLAGGEEVQARKHSHYEYDQGEPAGGPYFLVTSSSEGAQYAGGETDVRKVVRSYSGQGGMGWKLRRPTATIVDPEGLDLVHQQAYESATGQPSETTTPAAQETSLWRYQLQFGSPGSASGQFNSPAGITVSHGGQVYVADQANNRVQEFSASGRYLQSFAAECASKPLSGPSGVAVDGHGDVWVLDAGNDRVVEYNVKDECVSAFGGKGHSPGQLEAPSAITLDSAGHVWVADTGNHRIQEFSTTGEPLAAFGSKGSGEAQFEAGPTAVAVNAQGDIWASDPGNYRVQELGPEGHFLRAIGSHGAGNEQFAAGPGALALSPQGQLWVADPGDDRIEGFGEEGSHYLGSSGREGTGNAQFKNPTGVALDPAGELYVTDSANARVQKLQGQVGAPGAHTTQTVYYTAEANASVPACGKHAEWAGLVCETAPQAQPETTGVPNLPVTTATYNLLDEPTEIEQMFSTQANLVPNPSFENGLSGWSTVSSGWVSKGAKLTKASSGESGKSSLEVTSTGAATDEGVGAVIPGLFRAGVSYTASLYVHAASSSPSLQLLFGDPADEEGAENTEVAAGASWARFSVKWTPNTTSDYAQVVLRSAKATPASWLVDAVQVTATPTTVPYTDGEQSGSYWAGGTGESATLTNSFTRTLTYSYNTAGRLEASSVTSNVGAAVSPTTYKYNTENGLLAEVTQNEKKGLSTSFTYNLLGQLITYKDASAEKSEYTYDIDGRLASHTDGQGTQRYTYSGSTGHLESLTDTSGTNFTAEYTPAGQLKTIGYPGGLAAAYAYDPTGEPTAVEYTKGSKALYSDLIVPSIHGQWATQHSTLAAESYTYDTAGWLTKAQDTPAGGGCTTHLYAYDQDGDRTSETTRPPSGSACASEGGTSEAHTYDSADRLIDEGTVYDGLGDIAALPGADAGSANLTASFYANSATDDLAQEGQSTATLLDPELRPLKTVYTGPFNETLLSHYSGPGDALSWTVDEANGEWTRNIYGINGQLAATETNGKPAVLQLANLHGDIVATAAIGASSLTTSTETNEFGIPPQTSSEPPVDTWLAALGDRTEQPSGTTLIEGRAYQPQIGRYLQPTPTSTPDDAYTYQNNNPMQTSEPQQPTPVEDGSTTQPPPGATAPEPVATQLTETPLAQANLLDRPAAP